MDLSAVRTLARLYLDDRNSTRFSDTEILPLVNAAQAEIQKVVDDADEGFFSGVQTYNISACTTAMEATLPADFKKVILAERIVSDGDPIPVKWVIFQRRHIEHALIGGYPGLATRPVCYLRGNSIGVVEPKTSYVLRLFYTKTIADLSADTDISEIPSEFHGLIALYTAKLGFGSESRMLPGALAEEFRDQMHRLTMHVEQRERQEPRSVVYVEEF